MCTATISDKSEDVERVVAFHGRVSDLTNKRKELSKKSCSNKQNAEKRNNDTDKSKEHATQSQGGLTPSEETPSIRNETKQPKLPKSPCLICGDLHWMSSCPHLSMCREIANANTVRTTVTTTSLLTVSLTDYDVILDNASGPNIFRNKSLLHDITSRPVIKVGGINSSGSDLVVTTEGKFGPFNNVLYSPKASANVLSFSYALNNFNVRLVNKDFFIDTNQGTYHFKRQGDFHVYRASSHVLYSQRQLEATKEAAEIQKKLGYPGIGEFHNTVKLGGINNIPITSSDVLRIPKLLGQTNHEAKGKMTAPGPTPHSPDWFNLNKDKPNYGTLSIDVMTINSQNFLVGLIEEITLTLCTSLRNKTIAGLREGIELFIRKASHQNWILSCKSDGDNALKLILDKTGCADTSGPNRHVPVIERRIRTIKERVRTILYSLPYCIPSFFLKHLIFFVVSRLNLLTTTSSLNQYGNRPVNFNRDVRISFGEYVQVYNSTNKRTNTMIERSQDAIALYPTGNSSGSVKFYLLSTNKIVTRDKWTSCSFSIDIINRMNSLAKSPVVLNPPEEAYDLDDAEEPITATKHEELRQCRLNM